LVDLRKARNFGAGWGAKCPAPRRAARVVERGSQSRIFVERAARLLLGTFGADVEVWRGGRDGDGLASRGGRSAGRRVGRVGDEERGEEGVGGRGSWRAWVRTENSTGM
jgi:hypothetical protein